MTDETKYKLDFNKMYMSKEMPGVYWESVPENIRFYDHIIKHIDRMRKDKTQMYPPILYINSSIEEHFTQIVYIIKEHFTNLRDGFTGWDNFTKKTLLKLTKNDAFIYHNNYENGHEFTRQFPEKIDEFIEKYCSEI